MTNVDLDMMPPMAVDVEQAVLGCMLMSREALDTAMSLLMESSFYHIPHQVIYGCLYGMYKGGKKIDLMTLCNELRSKGDLDAVGGTSYLAQTIDAVSTTAIIEDYIEIIRDKHRLRNLLDATAEIHKSCYDDNSNPTAIIDDAEQRIFAISNDKHERSMFSTRDLTVGSMTEINYIFEHKGEMRGVPTGLKEIDRITCGFRAEDMVVIAARPSMGKTALALNIAEYVAMELRIPTAIFSLEMSKEQLMERLTSSRARISGVGTGGFEKNDWPRLIQASAELTAAPIHINDTPMLTATQFRSIARRMKMKYDIGLIIIDYIQLMAGEKKSLANRQEEVSAISRYIKSVAKELKVPIVVLSQLNREVEQRMNKEPQLSDLRESGSIEQDSDVVMMLVRQEFYDEEAKPGIADIFVAKQRMGSTGRFELQFNAKYTKFENITWTM